MELTKLSLPMDRRAQVRPIRWRATPMGRRWQDWSLSQWTTFTRPSRIPKGNTIFQYHTLKFITSMLMISSSQITKIWMSEKVLDKGSTSTSCLRKKWTTSQRSWATCRREMSAGILLRLNSMSLVVDPTLFSESTLALKKMARLRSPSLTWWISLVQKEQVRPKLKALDFERERISTSLSWLSPTWSTSCLKAQISSSTTEILSWQEYSNHLSEVTLKLPSSVQWLRRSRTIRRQSTLCCLVKKPKMSKPLWM